MRIKLLIAGVLMMSTLVIASGNAHANESKTILDITQKENSLASLVLKPVEEVPETVKAPEPPKDVVYEVKKGDTLEIVSKAHTTTWKRIWDKNSTITHPDHIKPGDKLTIPRSDEVLADRPLPTPPPTPVPANVSTPHVASMPARVTPRGAVSGNGYTYGYCTWHVKNMRPDLPNNLGNADTWYYRAQAQGLPTGTTPRVGAAGMTKAYMHVVYITAVNGNTVTVSEMNYRGDGSGGFGKVSYRTTSASEFLYIY